MHSFLDFLSPRYLVAALRVVPVLVVVLLMAPAWICWPFLPPARQNAVIEVLKQLVEWTKATKD